MIFFTKPIILLPIIIFILQKELQYKEKRIAEKDINKQNIARAIA